MAYVEVWKSGKLITRRRVDEQKAQKGCRVRLGSAGEVRVAIGQSETLDKLEVRMFAGEPPPAWQEGKEIASMPPHDNQSLLSFSAETPGYRAEQMDRYPDIEGYKIIEPLGEGGMGIVWRAEQLSTRRQVALKLMVSHRNESPKAQARFQREVELTARLDHPNIARIYDSGLHQGMYYYAMELVDGVPLDKYVKSKSLSRNQILALIQKVCQAVLFAHLHAVIHRDLKPSNIIVSPDGQPHVLDFGLAKALLEEDEVLTISVEGQIAGTPAYMSPEQAAGHHSQTDTRTDVFSLGVILYELLTGQSPYDLSGSTFDVLHQITEGTIQPPKELNKSIDRELEAILLKALALEPDSRYASAGALAKDISNYLDEEPLDARVPTTLYFLHKKALKYKKQVGIAAAIFLIVFGTVLMAYTRIVGQQAVLRAIEARNKSLEIELADLRTAILNGDKDVVEAALRVLEDKYIDSQQKVEERRELADKNVESFQRALYSDGIHLAELRDWGPEGKYFYDTDTGLYWWDPAEFVGWSYSDINAFVTASPIWKWASSDEIDALVGKSSQGGVPLTEVMGPHQFQTRFFVDGTRWIYGSRWIGYFENSPEQPDGWAVQTCLDPGPPVVNEPSTLDDSSWQHGVDNWTHGAWINSTAPPSVIQ